MNEEAIKQCMADAINPDDYPEKGGYRTAQDDAALAIRLYHARHVAPLVAAARQAQSELEHGKGDVLRVIAAHAHLTAALSAFDAGTPAPQPSPDVARLGQENAELRALVKDLTERAKADGERISSEWFYGNVDLCAKAEKQTTEALAATEWPKEG